MGIDFDRQVAIVTGSGRALGRAYAMEIARRGGSVVVSDIGDLDHPEGSRADRVVAEIKAAGGKAVACTENVAASEGAQKTINCAIDNFGRLDVMIHNAGILRPNAIENLTDQEIMEVIAIHLLGAFYLARPAWRIMKQQGYGRIVFICSSATFGNTANSNYAAAKSGIIGLTTSLGLEADGTGIKVNAVLPMAESDIDRDNPIPNPEHAACRAVVDDMVGRRDPAWVSALINYLASKQCVVNGKILSAFSGRYARVFPGIGGGWVSAEMPTAEQVGHHIDEIMRTGDAFAPESMLEEFQQLHGVLTEAGLI